MNRKEYPRYSIHFSVNGMDRCVVLENIAAPGLDDMLQVARDLAVRCFRDTEDRVVELRVVQLGSGGGETVQEVTDTVLVHSIE